MRRRIAYKEHGASRVENVFPFLTFNARIILIGHRRILPKGGCPYPRQNQKNTLHKTACFLIKISSCHRRGYGRCLRYGWSFCRKIHPMNGNRPKEDLS